MTATAVPTLFARMLGDGFARLAPQVAKIHLRSGRHDYSGEVRVRRGKGLIPGFCAKAARLPPARNSGPLRVEITAAADNEIWIRHFGAHVMPSRLWSAADVLAERLGLLRFGFRIFEQNQELLWQVAEVWFAGIPLPPRWFTGVVAREFEQDGRYHFEVGATLPLLGELIHYAGWLDVD
jgi:hypothetical protein